MSNSLEKQYDQSEKKLKILLHFIKEEIQENNYKLFNTKRSFIFNKLRLFIKDNEKKKETFLQTIHQQIERGIEQKSLNILMTYKKLIQALAYSQFTDIQRLSALDGELNNFIFDHDEDPFQYYNTKLYQIIINNKFLFRNRRQLQNTKIRSISQINDGVINGYHKRQIENYSEFQQIANEQDNQSINKEDQENSLINGVQSNECRIESLNSAQNQQSLTQEVHISNKILNSASSLSGENERKKCSFQSEEEQAQVEKENGVEDQNILMNRIDNKIIEDIKLEELFTYIFPTKNDICHQLTELENIVFLLSMTSMRIYKQKLKCTVYGSYMMGFQLLKSSDIDVSLELENNTQISEDVNSKRNFLKHLIEQFQQSDAIEVISFINAQVPGFQVRKQSVFNSNFKVKIDFTVGNHVGIAKTSLLKIYSSLSIRVQQLVCLFKYFIQVKNIDKQTLSSIAQTNMVVFFLLKQSYLPNVQDYFTPQQKRDYLTHHSIDEMQIKKIIEDKKLLDKINSTPLFNLFNDLINYYYKIVTQQPNQTLVISLLSPPAQISTEEQYTKYPFIIKEYYDDNHSVQPNPFFNFYSFQCILSQTQSFLQTYNQSTQLNQFINQIFSQNTQNDINQKNKQSLIDEFNLDINSDSDYD